MPRKRSPITGFTPTAQTPLLEFRSFGDRPPVWTLWLAYNPDRDAGTYLILNDDGSIWRETTYPDGSVQCAIITPPCIKAGKTNHE